MYERVHRGPFHEVKNVQPARNLRKRKSEIFSLSRGRGRWMRGGAHGKVKQKFLTSSSSGSSRVINGNRCLGRSLAISSEITQPRKRRGGLVCRDFNENLHSTAHATPPPPVFSECLSDLCHVRCASSREYQLNSIARVDVSEDQGKQ